eukprot:TRINITY_DN1614_c0_g1_i2.p1 TRINITY_DN1614_c0_g1~~TRINITY_DN1614_c0_g1_i2.p1  ORF type:complete len:188 (-),score=56.47 TRINITY_DN1614_c0_g1_i2:58-588(-)
MIKAILIINNHGKARLTKFFERFIEEQQQQIIKDCYSLISKRNDRLCNFIEGGSVWGKDTKLIYRHYATLYFIFAVDVTESELGILDLIQVFVESLDRCFENVCELDLVFHSDKIHYILDEMVAGGMVVETNQEEIIREIQELNKIEKTDNPLSNLTLPTNMGNISNIFSSSFKSS